MNGDEIRSALSQLATAVLGILTAVGVIDAGTAHGVTSAISTIFTSLSALIPALLLIANVAGSIYRHWNMVKAPENATIILPKKA